MQEPRAKFLNCCRFMVAMGRIKTRQVKRITRALMKDHREEMTDDFGKNKGVVDKFVELHSLKIRNVIAGYVTRLVKANVEK